MKTIQLLLSIILILTIISCVESEKSIFIKSTQQSEQAFNETLEKHLDAIINKDLDALKSTLSPKGQMQLIMQDSEIINSVDGFIDFHKQWFQDTLWKMETKVISTEIGNRIGLAITESIYREPERNGEPYFNRMIVTYGLEKYNGKWFVIQDHASSIIKSTDKK